MPKLDPTTDDFRSAAHRAVDWIGDYFDEIDSFPVLASVEPGEIESRFAGAPSETGKPYPELMQELAEKILPGITHWNHPAFLAYFSITGSQAGVIGEML